MTLYSLLMKILKDGDVTTSFDKEFHAVIQRCEKKWLRTFRLDFEQYSLYTCPRVERSGENVNIWNSHSSSIKFDKFQKELQYHALKLFLKCINTFSNCRTAFTQTSAGCCVICSYYLSLYQPYNYIFVLSDFICNCN